MVNFNMFIKFHQNNMLGAILPGNKLICQWNEVEFSGIYKKVNSYSVSNL